MAKLHTAIGDTRLLLQSKQQSFSLCESLKEKKKAKRSRPVEALTDEPAAQQNLNRKQVAPMKKQKELLEASRGFDRHLSTRRPVG